MSCVDRVEKLDTSCFGFVAMSVVYFLSSIFPCLLIFSCVSLSLFHPVKHLVLCGVRVGLSASRR